MTEVIRCIYVQLQTDSITITQQSKGKCECMLCKIEIVYNFRCAYFPVYICNRLNTKDFLLRQFFSPRTFAYHKTSAANSATNQYAFQYHKTSKHQRSGMAQNQYCNQKTLSQREINIKIFEVDCCNHDFDYPVRFQIPACYDCSGQSFWEYRYTSTSKTGLANDLHMSCHRVVSRGLLSYGIIIWGSMCNLVPYIMLGMIYVF